MKSLTLRLGPARVRVESDDSRPLEALRLMFPEYALTGPPEPTSDDPVLVDPCGDSQFYLRLPASWQSASNDATPLDWPDLVSELEHVVADRLLSGQREVLALHAGGVAIDGSGVLIIGGSGAGKSTLSVALARSGAPMLGDDVVLLGADGFAHPFQRRPKLDRDQASRMGIDPATTVLWDPEADECWLDPSAWSGWSAPVNVDVVVDAMHVPGEPTTVTAMTTAQTLAVLVGACFPTADPESDPLPERLLKLSTQCRGKRLRYAGVAEGVMAICDILPGDPSAAAVSGV